MTMSHSDTLHAISHVEEEKQYQKLVAQIALLLTNRLQIKRGNQIVGLIGDGTETSNQAALFNWISSHVPRGSRESPRVWAERLECRFKKTIDNYSS